jgi:hypothetical protein
VKTLKKINYWRGKMAGNKMSIKGIATITGDGKQVEKGTFESVELQEIEKEIAEIDEKLGTETRYVAGMDEATEPEQKFVEETKASEPQKAEKTTAEIIAEMQSP